MFEVLNVSMFALVGGRPKWFIFHMMGGTGYF
jgi:hypothetical protein